MQHLVRDSCTIKKITFQETLCKFKAKRNLFNTTNNYMRVLSSKIIIYAKIVCFFWFFNYIQATHFLYLQLKDMKQ